MFSHHFLPALQNDTDGYTEPHHSSVRNILAEHGGIRPPPRRRSARVLSLAEREEISRGLAAGRSIRAIAASLGRAPSTVSREVGRNEGPEGYRASRADQAAWDRARRPKPCKLALHRALAARVAEKIQRQWSPEQVAGWLKFRCKSLRLLAQICVQLNTTRPSIARSTSSHAER